MANNTSNSIITKLRTRFARSEAQTFIRSTFFVAGVLFVAICMIGLITRAIVDSTGVISAYLQGERFSVPSFTRSDVQPLYGAIITAVVLLFISSFAAFFWGWRAQTASYPLIVFNYLIYGVGQGIGFGLLFMILRANEIMVVFGITGGIFIIMSVVGFIIKNGMRLLPYLAVGTLVSLVITVVAISLYFANVYNDTLWLILFSLTGVLTCGYIVFDVWLIKHHATYAALSSASDPGSRFRFIAWFAFRLVTDLVTLIYIVARFVLASRR